MRRLLIVVFLFSTLAVSAQSKEEIAGAENVKLTIAMKDFHKSLVSKNYKAIADQTDNALSYGHSNGWVETKDDVINDLKNGKISYSGFKEDSIQIIMNDGLDIANIRFVADITATMAVTTTTYHLKVLEVWVKKRKGWTLFARQAVK